MPALPLNICGPKIRYFRCKLGWSRACMAAKCQLAGLDISPDIINRIERKIRVVRDSELKEFAKVLGVPVEKLLAE